MPAPSVLGVVLVEVEEVDWWGAGSPGCEGGLVSDFYER